MWISPKKTPFEDKSYGQYCIGSKRKESVVSERMERTPWPCGRSRSRDVEILFGNDWILLKWRPYGILLILLDDVFEEPPYGWRWPSNMDSKGASSLLRLMSPLHQWISHNDILICAQCSSHDCRMSSLLVRRFIYKEEGICWAWVAKIRWVYLIEKGTKDGGAWIFFFFSI